MSTARPATHKAKLRELRVLGAKLWFIRRHRLQRVGMLGLGAEWSELFAHADAKFRPGVLTIRSNGVPMKDAEGDYQ